MTRSVLFALAAAVLIAGCGPATNGTSGASSPTASQPAPAHTSAAATPSPATSAHAAGGAGCSSSNLTIKVDTSQGAGAAGSAYYPLDFTNTSASPCTLYGFPGVSFVTGPSASGSQLGRAAARNPSAAPVTVTIPPGGDAHAVLQVVNAGNYSPSACHPVTAHWLRVYPPGETVPLYASLRARACSVLLPAKLGSTLSVYPVRGGRGTRSQVP